MCVKVKFSNRQRPPCSMGYRKMSKKAPTFREEMNCGKIYKL